jgi:hypothetical protein
MNRRSVFGIRATTIGVRGRGRVEGRAVGVEKVDDDDPPVRGAHDVGRVVVQRSAPGQLSPGFEFHLDGVAAEVGGAGSGS